LALLTAVRTHLDGASVARQLDYLRALAPRSRFVACHGGRREDVESLPAGDALFVDDPTLRGWLYDQSLNGVLDALWEGPVRDDPEIDLVYVVEYDHLILSPDFERRLAALAETSGAGLVAKSASPRNDTNWSHHVRFRDDERLSAFVAAISQREDPGVRFGCLGPALLLRRDALEALCSLPDPPPCYFELYVPTVVHHLGFEILDVDAVSDLYAGVRWVPEYGVEEAIRAKRAGRAFVHPFKRLDGLAAIRDAPGPADDDDPPGPAA
jgi:hypothetical protein